MVVRLSLENTSTDDKSLVKISLGIFTFDALIIKIEAARLQCFWLRYSEAFSKTSPRSPLFRDLNNFIVSGSRILRTKHFSSMSTSREVLGPENSGPRNY